MIINKPAVASALRSAIQHYTDLTVQEQLTQEINSDADEAWKDVLFLINQLVEL